MHKGGDRFGVGLEMTSKSPRLRVHARYITHQTIGNSLISIVLYPLSKFSVSLKFDGVYDLVINQKFTLSETMQPPNFHTVTYKFQDENENEKEEDDREANINYQLFLCVWNSKFGNV